VVFLDRAGRSYALPANSLPSARGHGEPLISRLNPPNGTVWRTALLAEPQDSFLLASSDGYGFVVLFADLCAKNKAGKLTLSLSEGAEPLPPLAVSDGALVALASSGGHLLLFPADGLPRMAKGKGVKLIGLKPGETVCAAAVMPVGAGLAVHAGKRTLALNTGDLAAYAGERAQRGKLLPKGLQKVERLEVAPEAPPSRESEEQDKLF
jgi:topoisomerase-4 subunit A